MAREGHLISKGMIPITIMYYCFERAKDDYLR